MTDADNIVAGLSEAQKRVLLELIDSGELPERYFRPLTTSTTSWAVSIASVAFNTLHPD